MPAPGARPWRLLDTGVLDAARNIALDAALLELRARGESPDTIRFLKFSPDAALIGFHQSAGQELRLEWCRGNGVDVNRRVTGGGAVYFDRTQIGWEVIASRDSLGRGATMAELTGIICRAAALGLELLGIKAAFRPRNDIEVDGRKICGTGGAWEGDACLFQGTLLVDFDVEAMLQALRVPAEKLSRHELDSARERVTCIRECLPVMPGEDEIKAALALGLSRSLGIGLEPGSLTAGESSLAGALLEKYSSREWLRDTDAPDDGHQIFTSVHLAAGGTIRTSASFDVEMERLRSVMFTGDLFVSPRRAVYDIESRLRHSRGEELEELVHGYFREENPDTLGLGAADFITGVRLARRKLDLVRLGLAPAQAEAVTLVGVDERMPLADVLSRVRSLLLPYCAKSTDCGLRYQEGCDECGECGVGEVRALARSRGIDVVTVQSYEHLGQVFAAIRSSGASAYIGCCCEAFLVKRSEAFRQAGMEGIIVGIDNETCYDLSRQADAYAGGFAGQTALKTDVISWLLERLAQPVAGRRSRDAHDPDDSGMTGGANGIASLSGRGAS
ncbi:MAG: DUF116 domain-containing protein [Gaiellales bacterium]|nr:MAG: DUF116 domain-containing protein [Gaiellales bacterium]